MVSTFMCIFSFFNIFLLFSYSIFRPALMTPRFAVILGLGHVIGIYGALWAEGIIFYTYLFYYLGVLHFVIIFGIEIRKAIILSRR